MALWAVCVCWLHAGLMCLTTRGVLPACMCETSMLAVNL